MEVPSPRLSFASSTESSAADADVDADAPLTKQELEWIVATRDAAATQSLPCTNVELVQLAIVTKGDTAKALSRLKKMAAWKKDLSLDDVSFADAFRKNNATVMTSGYGTLTPYGRARSGSRVLCHWHSVRPMHMLPPLRVATLCYSITRCLCDTALCPSCAIADILSHTWRRCARAGGSACRGRVPVGVQGDHRSLRSLHQLSGRRAPGHLYHCGVQRCWLQQRAPLVAALRRLLSTLTDARGRYRCAPSSSSPRCTLVAVPCASSASCWPM